MSVPARFFTTVARRSLRPSSARLASSSPILSNFRVALPLRPSSILSQIPRRCFASEVSSSDAPAAAADASASTPSTPDSPDSEAPGATFGRPPKPPSPPQSPLPGDQSSEPIGKIERPSYQLTFTCKPCGHRSSHVVTKQAYHFGTTLIKCPSCMDRHVISDHLKIFHDAATSFEEILAKNGQTLRKGIKLDDDTIEFLKPEEDVAATALP